MTTLAALVLLVIAALAAPGAIVLAEWARTVLALPALAPGIPYITRGFQDFYVFVAVASVIVAVPLGWMRITRAEFRLSKWIGTFLLILIVWKVLDVTLWSDLPPGETGEFDTASNLVMTLGTFGYAVLAAVVFWYIAVRPHRSLAASQGVSS